MNHALRSSVRTALAPAVACGGTRYGRGGRPDDLYLYWRCGMRFYAYFRGSRARWRTSQVLYARQSSRFCIFLLFFAYFCLALSYFSFCCVYGLIVACVFIDTKSSLIILCAAAERYTVQ